MAKFNVFCNAYAYVVDKWHLRVEGDERRQRGGRLDHRHEENWHNLQG
jgi:hypothetical protein